MTNRPNAPQRGSSGSCCSPGRRPGPTGWLYRSRVRGTLPGRLWVMETNKTGTSYVRAPQVKEQVTYPSINPAVSLCHSSEQNRIQAEPW